MNVDSLLKKLRYKKSFIAQIVNLPEELDEISKMVKTRDESAELCDFSLLFIKNHKELLLYFLESIECGKNESIFWLAYPKKSGKKASDLNRDSIWQSIKQYGYRPASMVSINETWSAMRVRPNTDIK